MSFLDETMKEGMEKDQKEKKNPIKIRVRMKQRDTVVRKTNRWLWEKEEKEDKERNHMK